MMTRRHVKLDDHAECAFWDQAPSLQYWLPSNEVRTYLDWICIFLTREGENIMIVDGPGNSRLILDPPDTLIDPGLVRIGVDEARADWDMILRKAAFDGHAFEITAADGSGAVLTRWECSPLVC